MLVDQDNFVPITGVVHLATSLGVFLDVGERRVFIPANFMEPRSQVIERGKPATLLVLRWYAKQERLVE